MARTRSCVVVVACAVLCPTCLAADEETPQTGRIEVEVVYKNTGEPVEGAIVWVTGDGSAGVDSHCRPTGADGRVVEDRLAYGTHKVAVHNGHLMFPFMRERSLASRFRHSDSHVRPSVTISEHAPRARLRFEVERGRGLSGTVRRPDGSAFRGMVAVAQQEDPLGRCYAWVVDGQFEMWGLPSAEEVEFELWTQRAFKSAEPNRCAITVRFRSLKVQKQIVPLTGNETLLAIQVPTVTLDFVVDVVRPFWPFKTETDIPEGRIALWIGDHHGEDPIEAEVDAYIGALPGSPSPGWGMYRCTTQLDDFPANERITVAVAVGNVPGSADEEYASCAWSVIDLGTDNRALHLRVYEPYARVSRMFWFGVPSVIVLAVCGTVLVRESRRRRARERSG